MDNFSNTDTAISTSRLKLSFVGVLQLPGVWRKEEDVKLASCLDLDTACWRRRGLRSAICECLVFLTITDLDLDILRISVAQILKSLQFNYWVPLTTLSTDGCRMLTRENVIEMQRSQMEHMMELQKDETKKKQTEYEEKLLRLRQQETCSMRCVGDFVFFGFLP